MPPHGKSAPPFGHSGWVNSVAISPDGSKLATASKDGSLRIWQGATGEVVAIMRVDSQLNNCAWSSYR